MRAAALHPTERLSSRPPLWRRVTIGTGILVALLGLLAIVLARPTDDRVPAPVGSSSHASPIAIPAATALSSPATGTTGTIDLPPEPAGVVAADTGIVRAAPFSLHAAGVVDRSRALECLTAAIYYEAASESDDGQRAVAQVVLNRVRHPAFPATVCGVVYQGVGRGRGCQFSFACDGATARIPSRGGWSRAAQIAALALNGRVFAPVGLATHYHTYAVTPAWNRTLVMTDAIGAHFFHRWKGYWGTAAAFSQRYIGHEPLVGPAAAPGTKTLVLAMPDVATLSGDTRVAATIADVQPTYRDSGSAVTALPESTILDRWKDSGKPLK